MDSETLKKVKKLLESDYNKVTLSEEIGISRPTLNTRLEQDNWKKSEETMVRELFKRGDYANT